MPVIDYLMYIMKRVITGEKMSKKSKLAITVALIGAGGAIIAAIVTLIGPCRSTPPINDPQPNVSVSVPGGNTGNITINSNNINSKINSDNQK